MTVVSGTNLSDFPSKEGKQLGYCITVEYSLFFTCFQECHMHGNCKLTPIQKWRFVKEELYTADDPDFAQDPVSTQGSDDDYHSGSINSGRQKSTATLDPFKVYCVN